jgi:hypothetical protein
MYFAEYALNRNIYPPWIRQMPYYIPCCGSSRSSSQHDLGKMGRLVCKLKAIANRNMEKTKRSAES